MKRSTVFLLFAVLAAVYVGGFIAADVLAQDAPVFEAPAVESPYQELGTLTGVVAATLVVVEVIKRVLTSVPVFSKVPVWVIAIAVASALVAVANKVLGVLPGEFGPLAWQASLLAASASGFYSWLREPSDTPAQFAEDHASPSSMLRVPLPPAMIALPLIAALAIGGCAQTALGRYSQIQDSYIATVEVLVSARSNGLIDSQKWQRDILPLITAGDSALDLLKNAVARDADPNTIASLTETVQSVLRQLAREQQSLQQRGQLNGPSNDLSRPASRRISDGLGPAYRHSRECRSVAGVRRAA